MVVMVVMAVMAVMAVMVVMVVMAVMVAGCSCDGCLTITEQDVLVAVSCVLAAAANPHPSS